MGHFSQFYLLQQLFVNKNHGTIIPTGIKCKKNPCYMRDSAYSSFIVKKAKVEFSLV